MQSAPKLGAWVFLGDMEHYSEKVYFANEKL